MEFSVKTSKKDQIVDVTKHIEKFVQEEDISTGICQVFVKHTTCALTTADLDPGTDLDFLHFLRTISPEINYNHPHDPSHAPDHILSSIIGPSVSVPIKDGRLSLGIWQKIVLVELNGPKQREIEVSLISSE